MCKICDEGEREEEEGAGVTSSSNNKDIPTYIKAISMVNRIW